MPKIPTYVSTSSMTTATPSVATNLPNLNVNNTPAGALQPVSNYIRDSYIQEKTTEANNKSYKAINSFYEDQLDQQGNVSQKGWLTIQSEAKQKENPTEASEYYDAEVQKLYNYHKNNKLKNLNNFEKKAIDAKFYATSGLLKTKAIEEARLNLIVENKEVDDDTFVKESLLLQQLGPMYLPSFQDNMERRIQANPDYDDGVKKQLIKAYKQKGAEFLATSMATSQPNNFKAALKKGVFDDVPAGELLKLDGVASEQIKEQKFNILLKPLDIPFDANPRDFTLANEEIKNKTFGGNKELQKIFQSLAPQEKIEFEKEYQKKGKAVRSDRNMAILTQKEVVKVQTAIESKDIFDNMEKNKATYNKDLERIFGVNTAAVEQFTLVNEKVADGSANKLSNFDKNDDIVKFIINDKINTITDKFLLTGETGEGKSILERIGQDVNIADVKYLNNLLGISNEPNFKENHTEFFKFIDNFKDQVAGSVALQPLDPNKDARLNKFKYVMYNRYIDGLEKGINSDELLKATKGNKNFIGYDFYTFLPDVNDVFIGISNELKKNINNLIEQDDTPEIPFISLKREKEKELGRKLTIQEFRELIKEK
tara:strand:- start:3100 stop:4890 length:1791 start_codon:yes stop_codon:yes gene_type:complete